MREKIVVPQELDEEVRTDDDVVNEIDDCMDYYSNYRYQWNLNRMSPKAYGDMLRNKMNKKDGRSISEQPSHSLNY